MPTLVKVLFLIVRSRIRAAALSTGPWKVTERPFMLLKSFAPSAVLPSTLIVPVPSVTSASMPSFEIWVNFMPVTVMLRLTSLWFRMTMPLFSGAGGFGFRTKWPSGPIVSRWKMTVPVRP